MSDKIVTLARYHDPMAAELVRNRLEAEGIRVLLSGDTTGGLFAGLGGAFGTVHLQLAEEDLERAAAILEAIDQEFPEEEEDEEANSTAVTGRDSVKAAKTKVPAPPNPAIQESRPEELEGTNPLPADFPMGRSDERITANRAKAAAQEEDERDLRITWSADDLANRAFRAAVCGVVILPPLVTLYSVWLLLRLAAIDEDLSPQGTRRLYGALALDTAVLLAILFSIVVALR